MNEIAPVERAKTVLAYAETKARLAELAAALAKDDSKVQS